MNLGAQRVGVVDKGHYGDLRLVELPIDFPGSICLGMDMVIIKFTFICRELQLNNLPL